MRNVFLAGGGDAAASHELDVRFVNLLNNSRRFAYIPVAMEAKDYPRCQAWIESVFPPLGVDHIDIWTELQGRTLEELHAAGAVYLGGGHTTRLLEEVRRLRHRQWAGRSDRL